MTETAKTYSHPQTGSRYASGSLYGLAFGDALAAPTEFLTLDEIIWRYGPTGPGDLEGDIARVTDDTQMTLAVASALLDAAQQEWFSFTIFQQALRAGFVEWWRSPDNDRAPGQTSLQACAALAEDVPWQQASVRFSKGCGANMRVAPVGLVPALSDNQRAAAAQLQAALTHGHPTALAASDLTAFAVHWLRRGMQMAELPSALRDRCSAQREIITATCLATCG